MGLQLFVGPWPLLLFHNISYTDGKTAWTNDQPVARTLPIHRTTQTQNKRTHIHALIGIRIHDSSVRASEDSAHLRLRSHHDRYIYFNTRGCFRLTCFWANMYCILLYVI
jgi:hypothetical protein